MLCVWTKLITLYIKLYLVFIAYTCHPNKPYDIGGGGWPSQTWWVLGAIESCCGVQPASGFGAVQGLLIHFRTFWYDFVIIHYWFSKGFRIECALFLFGFKLDFSSSFRLCEWITSSISINTLIFVSPPLPFLRPAYKSLLFCMFIPMYSVIVV